MTYHSFDTEFGKADPLFRAIFSCDKEQIELLKKQGAVLFEGVRSTLVNGCRFLMANTPESAFMLNYMVDLGEMTAEEFLFAIPRLRGETGEPLNCTEAMIKGIYDFKGIYDLLFETNVFKCFMECFDQKKLNKAIFMQDIIDKNRVDMLALCAEHDWIKRSVKCDELIEYSDKHSRVECKAYLLAHKNRSFDLAAERKKAEARELRKLNGSPNKAKKPRTATPGSSAAMRQLWRFGKNAEGTVTISGYKGDSTEIIIPEKIGDGIVTRLKVDMMLGGVVNELFAPPEVRKSVTKITIPKTIASLEDHIFEEFSAIDEIDIPDGVTKIGSFAFCGCESLQRVHLSDSLTELAESTFSGCGELSEINIPEGITRIGKKAFCGCKKLGQITLPDSITNIGLGAFIGCSGLSEINIPSGITELPGS
ncbi:MAG: leucine-rich repeat protein, partial [Oscillospiraceae bacterium]|nr:leucine-rich repeat protein [Oscillospiraceae bacterium]